MSQETAPPRWAERVLRLFLKQADIESVSGDLLEEYRDNVYPARGQRGADAWYMWEVTGFALRHIGPWAAVFAGAFLTRTALDWLMPTSDFHGRATLSTTVGVATLLLASFRAASRSGSYAAGAIVGLATTALAAPLSLIGAAALLAVWHDPTTMSAIRGSGGLEEVMTLPVIMVLPGLVVGTIGGVLGVVARRLSPA